MKTGPEPDDVARDACTREREQQRGENAKAHERQQEHNLLGQITSSRKEKEQTQ